MSGESPSSASRVSGRHWWWMRGRVIASARFMRKSTRFTITCSTVVMMRLPPGLPVTRKRRPSRNRKVGVMEESGRLPGATALAALPTRP